MNRHLASIQKISNIEPIVGADRVELATIEGWKTIVQKDQFKIGEMVVFFEIDSLLPERPEFEFMRPHKYRVRVMKSPRLGVISQGLCMSLSDVNKGLTLGLQEDIGSDVTELLNVVKYEPPQEVEMCGLCKGSFPTHIIPKTDEMRIQSVLGTINEFKGKSVYITEKADGTSATYYYLLKEKQFGVCKRKWELKPDNSVYWELAKKYNIEENLRKLCEENSISLGIQGEAIGEKLGHKNPMQIKGHDLFLFNAYNINKYKYLDYLGFIDTAKSLGIPTVRILEEIIFDHTLEQLEEMAKGLYPNTTNPREGIVIRPTIETYSPTLMGRLSVKIENVDFRLKHQE